MATLKTFASLLIRLETRSDKCRICPDGRWELKLLNVGFVQLELQVEDLVQAHRLGLTVLLDVVHSHACKNVVDGLNR